MVNESCPKYRAEQGMANLSDIEILSLIIGGKDSREKAEKLIKYVDFDLRVLAAMKPKTLVGILTANEAKKVCAAFEIGRRKQVSEAKQKKQVTSSRDLAAILIPLLGELQHEEVWAVFLNSSNHVISIKKIHSGGIDCCLIDVRMILKEALLCGALSIVISHNHPSGSLRPSAADDRLTNEMKDASNTIKIKLLDHIIVGGSQYFSYADDGKI